LPHWAQTCLSLATSTSFPAVTCDGATSDGFSFWTVPFTYVGTEPYGAYPVSVTTNASVTISTVSIYAPLIQINWQASDRPTSTTARKTTTSVTLGTSSSSVSPSPHPSSGLSTRDKIAIGVVVPVVVISILLFLLFFRNKWRPKPNRQPTKAEAQPMRTLAELDINQSNVASPPVTQQRIDGAGVDPRPVAGPPVLV
jgi:hypothetical protein